MSDLPELMRLYDVETCGDDGYPRAWHRLTTAEALGWCRAHGSLPDNGLAQHVVGIKHLVRAEAGHRCLRCGHPFIVGESSVYDEGDDLHARRTERETGRPQAVADLAFEGMVADGAVSIDPNDARRTNWSACDEHCTHGGPLRARYNGGADPWTMTTDLKITAATELACADGGPVQAAWRILTVHHLNERKHDCRWWNLVALCQRCHLQIQGKVQLDRIWPWEHTPWFRPYVAGYYASVYLGEDLTRQEAVERLDELLALERVA